jgi:hypothetical protein
MNMRCAIAALALAPVLAAQSYTPPRAADGKADLQGIWQASSTAAAYNIEPHTPMLNIPGGVGVIVDPADGKIPYRPEARAKQRENFAKRAELDPLNKCFLPGVPRMMYLPFPFQILQRPEMVVMLSEYAHATRNIFLTGEHLDGILMWMGDARGRWEGDTLVVDTIGHLTDTWLDAAGNHHGDALHVVERFTRTGENTLTYEATFTDEKTYTRPWTMRVLMYRQQEPNFRLLEYECNAYMEIEAGRFNP